MCDFYLPILKVRVLSFLKTQAISEITKALVLSENLTALLKYLKPSPQVGKNNVINTV